MIVAGDQRGDPDIADRCADCNRLATEALGALVASGHDRVWPLEADITVIIDADTLTTGELNRVCETNDGAPLPAASIRRQWCQGRVTPIIVDIDGNVLDAGRTIRHANRAQRRALRSMYRT